MKNLNKIQIFPGKITDPKKQSKTNKKTSWEIIAISLSVSILP